MTGNESESIEIVLKKIVKSHHVSTLFLADLVIWSHCAAGWYNSIFWQKKISSNWGDGMLWLNSWVENPKNRDHLRSRSVINEIETRSGVIESTFFFTPTSPNCYFSWHNQRTDLNKRSVAWNAAVSMVIPAFIVFSFYYCSGLMVYTSMS